MSDSSNITIREFKHSDQAIIQPLILAGLGEHFDQIDPTKNPDLEDIYKNYIESGHLFVVAEAGGEIVGSGALIVIDPDLGRIVRVSVRPRCRGQGMGKIIVSYLLGEAKRRTLKRILVETNHDWYAAIHLYRSCGFKEFSRDPESIHMDLEL